MWTAADGKEWNARQRALTGTMVKSEVARRPKSRRESGLKGTQGAKREGWIKNAECCMSEGQRL